MHDVGGSMVHYRDSMHFHGKKMFNIVPWKNHVMDKFYAMQNNEHDVLLTYNCNVKNSAAAGKIKRFVGNVCTNIIVNYKTVLC